jgi:hypothetical protein
MSLHVPSILQKASNDGPSKHCTFAFHARIASAYVIGQKRTFNESDLKNLARSTIIEIEMEHFPVGLRCSCFSTKTETSCRDDLHYVLFPGVVAGVSPGGAKMYEGYRRGGRGGWLMTREMRESGSGECVYCVDRQ